LYLEANYRGGMADRPRVLIVGAGIGGLTLAAGLHHFGIAPTVVELESSSLGRGLALMLTSNAGLALRRIGLDRAVVERGTVLEEISQIEPSGAPIDDHDLRSTNDRYAPTLGITRDGLMSALSAGLSFPVTYGTTVASLDQSTDSPRVTFSDGTRAQFDLVVGADGIGSATRKMILPRVEPVYRSFCAWRTVMECPDIGTIFTIRSLPGTLLGSFQVGPGLVYVFLLAHTPEIPGLSRTEHLARFKELALAFRGPVVTLIQEQEDPARVVFVPVQEVETASYRQGRVVLIGDAAHAFPPLLAQGAAMAIEDAVTLAELVGQNGDLDDALRSYEAARRPRVESIRAAVRRVTVTRGFEGPVTAEILERHPPVFSNSLKVYDDLIEDPFAIGARTSERP
jgi:2-polyprenyl-6-methoxyphenol hydroxylase-like FAD-dependent oxidoreductase